MKLWYLATPYTKHPDGIEAAWEEACRITAKLILANVPVYSPIAHTHPVAIHGGIDPLDHEIWLTADEPMMQAATGLMVAMMTGWEGSYGIGVEIEAFTRAGKPVVYLDPDTFEITPRNEEEQRIAEEGK
jgi:hypothetical protein